MSIAYESGGDLVHERARLIWRWSPLGGRASRSIPFDHVIRHPPQRGSARFNVTKIAILSSTSSQSHHTSTPQLWHQLLLQTHVSHVSRRTLVSGGPRRSSSRSRSTIDSKRSSKETSLPKRPVVKEHERAVRRSSPTRLFTSTG
jgi:hypothetical protein